MVRCDGGVAKGHAAAVCGGLVVDNTLTVRAGSLIVGGDSRIASPLRVENGSFIGIGGIEGDNTEDVDGDLSTASNWMVTGPAHVGGNATVGGRLDARNSVRIDGVLRVASDVSSGVEATTIMNDVRDVPAPLSCEGAPDVVAIADAAAQRPGVADEGETLAAVSEPTHLTLGCGTYRFDSWGVDNDLTLRVEGKTVIVVDGDMRIASPTHVVVAPGGSLDFVVTGGLQIENTLSIDGAPTWLAVAGDVKIASPTRLTGWLVAPKSEVLADNTLDVDGALLVGSLRVASPVTVAGSERALELCSAR
jgi:cytoskeletal protein CcmA (bactofilin family)